MTHEDYAAHVETFIAEMVTTTKAKNADYSAGTDDAMHDYHASAIECDVTPMQAWFMLFMKHVRAVQRYVRTGAVASESIHGRFIDLANYAMLGDALVRDLATKERR